MAIFKCKMCGGDLNVTEEIKIIECDYCGTSQTVAAADSEKKITLFNRANRLRMTNDFDKAAGIYESIIADFPEEAEAYWGLCLCKYGIEYVDDPATAKKIPTCHRSSFESIMDDSDFEQVMEYADALTRKVYRDEAKQIEEIRKGIIAVSANEEPYDIFICYKETAENGDRTLDSVIAQDVYDELTGKGYRVFFSRITLEDKLGVEYEPYIFAALNSAKIMLVFGTTSDHIEAVWVRNEWSRFLKLMAKDRSKVLIPCFKDMDAYELPTQFRALQAQDMGKVGATQDLMRGIEKILPKNNQTVAAPVQSAGTNPSVESYLKRVFIFLEDGDFKSADEYCEKVLDIDPENGRAYLGKLMAELRVRKPADLKYQSKPFNASDNFIKAKRYGNELLVSTIDSYITYINERNEKARIKAKQEHEQAFANARNKAKLMKNLVSAHHHTVGIKSDGTAFAVGLNENGQCNVSGWRDIVAASVSYWHTVGLTSYGTVVAVGRNKEGQCKAGSWTDIVAVSAGELHTVGLKSDGTVVAVGDNKYGQCNVGSWRDIVAVATGVRHTVGLKSDGTVVATEYIDDRKNFYLCHKGQCNVSGWKDIVEILAYSEITVGLKSDGTVVAVGENDYGQCNVSGWRDIVAISFGSGCTVGLKSNGTVVAVGFNNSGACNVSGWRDIVAIASGGGQTVGLKSDGTVVAAGYNEYGQCNVSGWKDIVAVLPGCHHTVGLKSNGTVVAAGWNKYGQSNVSDWRLFTNIDSLEQERKKLIENAFAKKDNKFVWRSAGVCQHCGSEFKGLFTKKCVRCGKPKDY